MEYQNEITARIKDVANGWIEVLKEKYPDLHLTRQWRLVHSSGFVPGYSTVPVVTSSGSGPHLIGEVGFQVSSDLEIDLDDLEFVQKDEPYVVAKPVPVVQPLSQPLNLLNDILVGLNEFITGVTLGNPIAIRQQPALEPYSQPQITPIKIHKPVTSAGDLDEIILQLKHRVGFPEWLRTIGNQEVQDTLFGKIAESYLHYRNQNGLSASLAEFLKKYEEYLQQEGKLYSFCTYKGKPVDMDGRGWCEESYCSKKPYQKPCAHAGLKFGQK